jgi:hypothetical protein
VKARLAGVVRTIAAIMRALADEDAYARHVARHGGGRRESDWAKFVDERFRARNGRGRCC